MLGIARVAGARTIIAVSCLPLLAGLVAYGLDVLALAVVGVVAALAVESAIELASRHRDERAILRAAMLGLLVVLTVPVWVSWYIPAIGSAIAVVVARLLALGRARRFWHPVAISRVVLGLMFAGQFAPSRQPAPFHAPVLARGHLVAGDLSARCTPGVYYGWLETVPAEGCQAWLLVSPVHVLRTLGDRVGSEFTLGESVLVAVRDELPPWLDTWFGLTGGAIGEGGACVLVLAAIWLGYRRYVRGAVIGGTILGGAMAASILPVRVGSGDVAGLAWLPILAATDGLPVGVVYVLHHLTAGDLMLVACLLTCESVRRVKRRQQMVFAFVLGVLVIGLRLYGPEHGAGYWGLLATSTIGLIFWRPVVGVADGEVGSSTGG